MQFSYADAVASPRMKRVVRWIEQITGGSMLPKLYEQQRAHLHPNLDPFSRALMALDLRVQIRGMAMSQIPTAGGLLVVANHPFGVVDGLVACQVMHRVRSRLRVMAINLVEQFEELRPWTLPVDFSNTAEAMRTNLQSRAAAIELLRQGECLILFPAGQVATAPRICGRALEHTWHSFVGRIVQAAEPTILPLHFEGQNSCLFHLSDWLGPSFRLAMLLRETRRLVGTAISVTIGEPIAAADVLCLGDRRQIAAELRRRTLRLAEIESEDRDSVERGVPNCAEA